MTRLRSLLVLTALLAVSLPGLEAAGALTGGGAVAVAASLDPPPGGTPPGEAETQPAPEIEAPPEEPLPPGMRRFELPPDPQTPDPETPDPEAPDPQAPDPQVPAEPEPEPVPVEPEAAPAPMPPAALPGAGTPVLAKGDRGRKVQALQVRLHRVGALRTPATGVYGTPTEKAVKRFQRKLRFVATGAVDAATQKALVAAAGRVTKKDIAAGENRPYGSRLASSCLTGSVICIDKTARTVRWVVDGEVVIKLDARFGSSSTPTREGLFRIQAKSRDHVSKLYDSPMPFALFFSRGQAVHYSPDFASRGYYGASHGCVNTREYSKMRRLYESASIGDPVVVYRSRPVKG